MADVTHRGAGAVGEYAASASWVTNSVSGVQVDDYLILGVMVEAAASPNSGLTGWNAVGSPVTFFFAGDRYHVYDRKAQGNSDDAPSIGFSASRSGSAVINAFYNQDLTTPIGTNFLITSTGNVSTAAPIVHASLTSAAAGSMLAGFGAAIVGKSGTLIVDNSATLDSFKPNGDVSSTKVAYTFHKAVGSGATGDTTVTNVDPLQIPQRYAWFTGIIAPAAGGGGSFQAAWARNSNVVMQ